MIAVDIDVPSRSRWRCRLLTIYDSVPVGVGRDSSAAGRSRPAVVNPIGPHRFINRMGSALSQDALEPVSREATASIIAGRIRKAITDGVFPPGMQLGEASLASRLGVSRGPVREALQRLIQEGLLRSEPHRGVTVAVFDEDDVADIFRARVGIERAAVEAFLERSEADREHEWSHLETLVAEMAEVKESARWADLADVDLRFHEALVAASGSKRLVRMYATLLAETRLCLAALEDAYPVRDDLVAEHRRLLEALAAADPSAADLVESHLRDAARSLRDAG
jgi:DNA-binding GntR family transcriptional regulator